MSMFVYLSIGSSLVVLFPQLIPGSSLGATIIISIIIIIIIIIIT